MFGVVPKPLWSRKAVPDKANRIQLDTNCLLIRSPGQTVLVDTGFGTKLPAKEYQQIDANPENTLLEGLKAVGVAPVDVSHVLFSHLHFDHSGGATRLENGELQLTFPNAVHVIQQAELADALGSRPELAGTYYQPELKYLSENARLHIAEGSEELLPFVKVVQTGGHTPGHQAVHVSAGDFDGIFLGDLCPTAAHLNVFWTMAYDAFQLDVRRRKFELLARIAEKNWVVFFDHDPEIRAATLKAKNERSFEIDQVLEIR